MFIDVLIVLDKDIYFPPLVPYRIKDKRYPYSRTGEIVSIFKKNMKMIKTSDYRDTDKEKYEGQLVKFAGDDYACFTYSPVLNKNITYAIEHVDTKRPWTIIKSNSGERIKYFDKKDKFKIIDRELNYGVYE